MFICVFVLSPNIISVVTWKVRHKTISKSDRSNVHGHLGIDIGAVFLYKIFVKFTLTLDQSQTIHYQIVIIKTFALSKLTVCTCVRACTQTLRLHKMKIQ